MFTYFQLMNSKSFHFPIANTTTDGNMLPELITFTKYFCIILKFIIYISVFLWQKITYYAYSIGQLLYDCRMNVMIHVYRPGVKNVTAYSVVRYFQQSYRLHIINFNVVVRLGNVYTNIKFKRYSTIHCNRSYAVECLNLLCGAGRLGVYLTVYYLLHLEI